MEGADQPRLSPVLDDSQPEKPEAEQSIVGFEQLLQDELGRQAVTAIVGYDQPSELFSASFNLNLLSNPEHLPNEELWIAIKSLKRLLMSPGLDRGMRLDVDPLTWSIIEQHPRFKKFMAEGIPKNFSSEQVASEKLALSCIKLSAYTNRYIEFNPLPVSDPVQHFTHSGRRQQKTNS